jgi:3-hydroxy-3-methylglutaryl CoA synthase
VANALTQVQAQEQLIAFSYGSGCGSELLTLNCIENQATAAWVTEIQQDLAQREIITAAQYQELRNVYDLSL